MAKKSVVWTKTAARQRHEILKYWTIRNQSEAYAIKLIEIIKVKTILLQLHPESGVKTDMKNVRVSVIGHFSLYYKHTDSEIIIVAFWDNSQDPKRLLEILTN